MRTMQDSIQNLRALNPGVYTAEPLAPLSPWYRGRNFLIFITIFLLVSISGLLYCFSREPVYRSTATLALRGDEESTRYWANPADSESKNNSSSGIQHIAEQSRILLDPHLLQTVWSTIQKNDAVPASAIPNFSAMRNMLALENQPDTNLVELRADGSNPDILPMLIDVWIETYRAARTEYVALSTSSTNVGLSDQLETLEKEIDSKREDIEVFRAKNGILSDVRDENPALTKLTGLNEALNLANEDAVKARTRLESVREAIARGEPIFLENSNNAERLAELEKSAQVLREKIATMEKQYTPDYIRLVPNLKSVPEQLRTVEAKIARLSQIDQERVLSIAEQESRAADQKVRTLQQQLDEYRQTASSFSARFVEYQEKRSALDDLESRLRSTQNELLHTEVRQHQKYPDIEVISEPFLPQQSIGPDNFRDAGIATGGAVILALLGVWLANFLLPKSVPAGPTITLSGIHLHPNAENPILPSSNPLPRLDGTNPAVASLAQPVPEELSEAELQVLWDASPLKARQLIATLLTGITIEEAAMITAEHFDIDGNRIEIPGDQARLLELPATLKKLLAQSPTIPAWRTSTQCTEEDLRAYLDCLSSDADLPSEKVTPEALRHTYLMYLVRLGIRLTEIGEIAGYLPPSMLAFYRSQSPRGPGKSLDEIDLVHPLLRN